LGEETGTGAGGPRAAMPPFSRRAGAARYSCSRLTACVAATLPQIVDYSPPTRESRRGLRPRPRSRSRSTTMSTRRQWRSRLHLVPRGPRATVQWGKCAPAPLHAPRRMRGASTTYEGDPRSRPIETLAGQRRNGACATIGRSSSPRVHQNLRHPSTPFRRADTNRRPGGGTSPSTSPARWTRTACQSALTFQSHHRVRRAA